MALKTLVIVDSQEQKTSTDRFELTTFDDYLTLYPKQNEPKTRVINLCDTQRYLSKGYYCSLLAEARQHKVLPSVQTINQLRDITENKPTNFISSTDAAAIKVAGEPIEVLVYFGWVEDVGLKKFAKRVFDTYPAPILLLKIWRDDSGVQFDVRRKPFTQLNSDEQQAFFAQLDSFMQLVWRTPLVRKNHRWDMAILVNPDESDPPSNRPAIARFVKAAAKFGIRAEPVTARNLESLSYYDALFIRETTAIDHHTYRLASRAQAAGLIVMDDPNSILRCCNKVYLHDAFTYKRIPSPRTKVVSQMDEAACSEIESLFGYPLVLKMPEGSFSKGVFKVKDRSELETKLADLFKESALVLAQEYLYTEFDWRIGVLNGRAIYACRYHMARNHWQIYNHSTKRNSAGSFDTLPTFEAPNRVLDAAVNAANMVGNGLYGVDIKQRDQKVYVIEVNDNPNIDHKIEDAYLGDELYMIIMAEFHHRLESFDDAC